MLVGAAPRRPVAHRRQRRAQRGREDLPSTSACSGRPTAGPGPTCRQRAWKGRRTSAGSVRHRRRPRCRRDAAHGDRPRVRRVPPGGLAQPRRRELDHGPVPMGGAGEGGVSLRRRGRRRGPGRRVPRSARGRSGRAATVEPPGRPEQRPGVPESSYLTSIWPTGTPSCSAARRPTRGEEAEAGERPARVLVRSTDGGQTWAAATAPPPSEGLEGGLRLPADQPGGGRSSPSRSALAVIMGFDDPEAATADIEALPADASEALYASADGDVWERVDTSGIGEGEDGEVLDIAGPPTGPWSPSPGAAHGVGRGPGRRHPAADRGRAGPAHHRRRRARRGRPPRARGDLRGPALHPLRHGLVVRRGRGLGADRRWGAGHRSGGRRDYRGLARGPADNLRVRHARRGRRGRLLDRRRRRSSPPTR